MPVISVINSVLKFDMNELPCPDTPGAPLARGLNSRLKVLRHAMFDEVRYCYIWGTGTLMEPEPLNQVSSDEKMTLNKHEGEFWCADSRVIANLALPRQRARRALFPIRSIRLVDRSGSVDHLQELSTYFRFPCFSLVTLWSNMPLSLLATTWSVGRPRTCSVAVDAEGKADP